jgi:fatty-acyl-CoA synthase
VANALADLGSKYDRVAILAHNTVDHVLTWLGCCKIGAVYLAINYLLKGKDISYCIDHSESKGLHRRGCPLRIGRRMCWMT